MFALVLINTVGGDMKNLSIAQLKAISDLDIRVDGKLLELDRLAKKFQNNYLLTGENSQLDAAGHILNTINLENKHRGWQKEILAKDGEDYLFAYTNALEQIISNSEFLLENYAGLFQGLYGLTFS